jgi:hypothetical protein
LNATPLPAGVHVTSIGARSDAVVPALHTRLAGADNIVIDSGGGPLTHDELPGSAPARREVALAVHGLPPTCQTLADMIVDTISTQAISWADDSIGIRAWALGHWVDSALPLPASIPVFYAPTAPTSEVPR